MSRQVAKEFWTSCRDYPAFGSKQRRFYELMWTLPKLEGFNSLLEIGCGSGEFLDLLTKTTDIEKFFGCDISESLLAKVGSNIETFVFDMYDSSELPSADVILMWASLQYIFEDSVIEKLLASLKCKKLLIRTPCEKEDLIIEKFSKELGANYSSRYMTLDNLLKLLSKDFTVIDVARAYPERIESKFGSKQWLIECTKKV